MTLSWRARLRYVLIPGHGQLTPNTDSQLTPPPQREIYAFARHHYRQREGKTQAQIDARTAAWNEERARWSHRLQTGKEERERMKKENESLGELMGRLQGAGIIAA